MRLDKYLLFDCPSLMSYDKLRVFVNATRFLGGVVNDAVGYIWCNVWWLQNKK